MLKGPLRKGDLRPRWCSRCMTSTSECPVEEKEEAAGILVSAMESAADMEVPMKVDVSFGENWYEAKA